MRNVRSVSSVRSLRSVRSVRSVGRGHQRLVRRLCGAEAAEERFADWRCIESSQITDASPDSK